MEIAHADIGANSTMEQVLQAYPGARRALFRRYHIGGCSSCGFQPSETLGELCQRNNQLDVAEVLEHIKRSHEQDAALYVAPQQLIELKRADPGITLLDIRSRTEFDAARIEGSVFMDQQTMQEIMGQWPREKLFVIVDHEGKQALDAAAYFLGHGFHNVRCLQGGIDAWARDADPQMPRYQLA